MINLKKYQEKALEELTENTYDLLKSGSSRHKLVLQAPTGAGKTFIMAAYLERLANVLPDKTDLPSQKVAYIWLAPNQLHEQSFWSLKSFFENSRSVFPVYFEDISDNMLKPNEVLCLNWQSVSREDNVYVRDNEQSKSLFNFIENSKNNGIQVIVILDEAHLFATKGKKAIELLAKINASIEIDVSATPYYKTENTVIIKRRDVISAQMIKKNVVLNPLLDEQIQGNKSLNEVLIEQAMTKRKDLEEAYKKLGVNVRPLLLIQLPNDTIAETDADRKVKNEILTYLSVKNITKENGKLAIWLSDQKDNLEDIEQKDGFVDVLIFKQAIALGWDCPRAAVLLIFRELKQETFTIQTVGRILRMPEQKHYPNEILNRGYVYTDLSKDMIKIVGDDMDYILQQKALRIPEYCELRLPSIYINSRVNRNRLGVHYKPMLFETSEKKWEFTRDLVENGFENWNKRQMKSKGIETDVNKIDIPIPKDVELSGDLEIITVREKVRFARTRTELERLLDKFCRRNCGQYAVVDSTPTLLYALKMLLIEYCGYEESEAMKVMLYANNQPLFEDLISQSYVFYAQKMEQEASKKEKVINNYAWDVPTEKIFNENYLKKEAERHALIPFYIYKNSSLPEQNFITYLENHYNSIDWWYKNGSDNQSDFAVLYENKYKEKRAFYVDFIIFHKNGTLALFDTKTLDSDPEFCNKHNALLDWIDEIKGNFKNVVGGVIVPVGQNWKYSVNKIDSPKNTEGWVSYNPSTLKDS